MRPTTDEVLQVHIKLTRAYGTPDLGNKADPLDELVFIIMSTMTTSKVHSATYAAVKAEFHTWAEVLSRPVTDLIEVLKPAGLSQQKGERVYQVLERIKGDTGGAVTLGFLKGKAYPEVEQYLLSLPGVGKKVARCVMIYSLDIDAFPVDAHVLRVCKRLGWIAQTTSWAKAHDLLQAMVPYGYGHDLHVNMVVHGRRTCFATQPPACPRCPLFTHCDYARSL